MNDVKIAKTVESFHLLVHTLLNDNTERELFFKVRSHRPRFSLGFD